VRHNAENVARTFTQSPPATAAPKTKTKTAAINCQSKAIAQRAVEG